MNQASKEVEQLIAAMGCEGVSELLGRSVTSVIDDLQRLEEIKEANHAG